MRRVPGAILVEQACARLVSYHDPSLVRLRPSLRFPDGEAKQAGEGVSASFPWVLRSRWLLSQMMVLSIRPRSPMFLDSSGPGIRSEVFFLVHYQQPQILNWWKKGRRI